MIDMCKLLISNLSFSYPKSTALFEQFNLSIQNQQKVFLLGANGSGKTSLMKLILGALSPENGSIHFGDRSALGYQERSSIIGYIPQNYCLDGEMNGIDTINLIAGLHFQNQASFNANKSRVIDALGLNDLISKRIKFLSGGQKQLLNICLGLLHNPEIIILDEPFVGLDYVTKSQLMAFINSENKTTICITHDIEFAEHNADRIALINQGRLEAYASPKEMVDKNSYQLIEIDFDPSWNIDFGSIAAMQYSLLHNRLILSFKNEPDLTSQVNEFLKGNENGVKSIRKYIDNLRSSLVGAYNFSMQKTRRKKGRGKGKGNEMGRNRNRLKNSN